jgi:PEP-CTERM motif
MKTLLKTLLTTAMLVAASASQAGTINISFDANAAAAEATFVASLNGPLVVENFNGLGGAQVINPSSNYSLHNQHSWENKGTSIVTNVGTFDLITAGQTGDNNIHNNQLMIESSLTGEYGRETLAQTGVDRFGRPTYDTKDFWLDSNDAKLVTWTFGSPLAGEFNAFGFYIADATDRGATLTLNFKDGSSSTASVVIPAFLSNGNVGYVSVTTTDSIVGGVLTFNNSTGADGWGIDDVTIGYVPEPGALMLMGFGLLGLGAARRRAKA